MDVDFNTLKQRVSQWISPFFEKEEPPVVAGSCCISLLPNTLSLITLDTVAGTPDLRQMQTQNIDTLTNARLSLTAYVQKNELTAMPTHLLLSPADYQLFMIESMPVPEADIPAALLWRVRSLITTPIEDVIIDYFTLPAKKSTPNHPMVTAIVANKEAVMAAREVIKASGLKLTHIDIPELAMARLTAPLETDEKATVFFYFMDHAVIMNISAEKTLYFTRQLLLERDSQQNIDYAKLSLDIKRYLDFFRSQWRYASPSRLLVACQKNDPQIIASALSDCLLTPVTPLPLPAYFIRSHTEAELNPYLLNLGCLLPSDKKSQTVNLLRDLKTPENLHPWLDWKQFKRINGVMVCLLFFYFILLNWQAHHKKQLIADAEKNNAVQKQLFLDTKKAYPALFLSTSVDETIEAQKRQLETQKRIVSILEKRTPFSQDLIGIGNAITPNVWLTEIDITDNGDVLLLTGNSLSMDALQTFSEELTHEPVFSKDVIHIKTVNKTQDDENAKSLIAFTLQIEHAHHEPSI